MSEYEAAVEIRDAIRELTDAVKFLAATVAVGFERIPFDEKSIISTHQEAEDLAGRTLDVAEDITTPVYRE